MVLFSLSIVFSRFINSVDASKMQIDALAESPSFVLDHVNLFVIMKVSMENVRLINPFLIFLFHSVSPSAMFKIKLPLSVSVEGLFIPTVIPEGRTDVVTDAGT